jgi:hypothetical protein
MQYTQDTLSNPSSATSPPPPPHFMDIESLQLATEMAEGGVWGGAAWQALVKAFRNAWESFYGAEYYWSQGVALDIKRRRLTLKCGFEISLEEMRLAMAKYHHVDNINSAANILRSGFNITRVRYFLRAVAELLEMVVKLPHELLADAFLQNLLTDLIGFYDLQRESFESRDHCFGRIVNATETIENLLKLDILDV